MHSIARQKQWAVRRASCSLKLAAVRKTSKQTNKQNEDCRPTGSLTSARGWSRTYALFAECVVKLLVVVGPTQVCQWSRSTCRVERLDAARSAHLFTPTNHAHTHIYIYTALRKNITVFFSTKS